jgi:hypothetical protein
LQTGRKLKAGGDAVGISDAITQDLHKAKRPAVHEHVQAVEFVGG